MSIINLKQSGIRSATIRCEELGGVNLGQGVCDLPTPDPIKKAAEYAITHDCNMYGPYKGIDELRSQVRHKILQTNKIELNSNEQILVTSGSTGAYVSAVKSLLNDHDEAIIFEPFYGYHKQILELHNIRLKTVPLNLDKQFNFDIEHMESLITPQTKVIVLCNPSNPTGKVFNKDELNQIGQFANKHNLYIITDEIYEHVVYPPYEHTSIGSMPEYSDRVISIFGMSKTYQMTGWRIGYAVGPQEIIKRMGLIHDLIYICAPTPLQHAVVTALKLPSNYYSELKNSFLSKRNFLAKSLTDLGFKVSMPQGAYYLMADYSELDLPSDSDMAANELLEKAKVAVVPAKYFYLNSELALKKLRFCFALSEKKIKQGVEQLQNYLKFKTHKEKSYG